MVWICPFSCEQAPRQKATSTPSIPTGFQPEQKKNQENHFSSKGNDGLSIHIVLVFLTLVFHRSEIIQYTYSSISQTHIIPQWLALFNAQGSDSLAFYYDIPFT